MYKTICDIINGNEFSVVESFEIPGQPARFSDIPPFLFESKVGEYLKGEFQSGVWTHQGEALEHLGNGDNVVVSTGTASGKSLIFRALALHKVLLNPESRVLVFYPLRALIEDQLRGWRDMARVMGLNPSIVGRIDGTVRPFQKREEVLEEARIIVMTPDVCQAWLMSRLAMPLIRTSVGAISTLIMDEAHTLEGVFGSNFAFLIRRLLAARDHILSDTNNSDPVQLVAATATIANPGDHMRRLTGAEFTVVDHKSDGAQRYERVVAHIACPEGGELDIARELQQRVIANGHDGTFITFVDSRKGVETLAMATDRDTADLLDDPAVSPYRAGYTPQERRKIESELRSGAIKGVVSTSALELGIDFPSLTAGFNVGIPTTRKAYRQRLGRVGRNGPGAFVVVGSPNEFRQYGTTLEEYHDMSVEPSYLYLDNRFMQFAHGRCLADEREAIAAPARIPSIVDWPDGFSDAYQAARPEGNRPREYDAVAQLGGDSPHYGYPLRNVGERNFQIKLHENSDPLGESSESQALRESYPGATYFHNMRPYYVAAWHARTFERPFVRVRRGQYGRSTRPRIRTWINAAITSEEIIDGHLIRGDSGFVAECEMLITEKVDGYFDGRSGEFHSYQELQQTNPNMRARSRNFRTTGVVLCVDEDWFRSQSVKRSFSDRLREVFSHEFSVSTRDIGSAASNIVVVDGNGVRRRAGLVTIFDQTYGSLRFTESLYLNFDHILDRLGKAARTDPTEGTTNLEEIVDKVRETVSKFTPASPFSTDLVNPPTGYEQVFKPGSLVCYRESGFLAEDVEIIQVTMMDGVLRYQVKANAPPGQPELRRWIPASATEPSADADSWEVAWWNVASESFEYPPDEDDTA